LSRKAFIRGRRLALTPAGSPASRLRPDMVSPVGRRAKATQSPQISADRPSQKTTSQHFFASPERIQSSKATNMLSDLQISIGKNPLVPT
jgi:hypothetical protein